MALNRRDFLKTTAVGAISIQPPRGQMRVRITGDDLDRAPAAAACLRRTLQSRGIEIAEVAPVRISAKIQPGTPESFSLSANSSSLSITAGDARGLGYALFEVADRVAFSEMPMDGITGLPSSSERPSNTVRAVSRLFTSDVEDKPWFNDREMWPAYFEMLATQRFNRFHLAFGIGYDFLRDMTDCYLVFCYPFLVSPKGYNVRATNLPDSERDNNLKMLQYISDQAATHGLDFQLGVWTHGYQWANSPKANSVIEGLTPETHAAYCRDALTEVLRACPNITGVTFRIHGESGVAEGNYPFWKTVFDGVVRSGRKVEIDMHSKGIDDQMIDVALGTGMPVTVSPKFWAEHMGLPYHQTDIREQEYPRPDGTGLMARSAGSRNFTRYGYADLMKKDRRYRVIHRIWSGTRRILLWGDPEGAAAYSRAFQFCGSAGVDLMEPLSFKGRRGSGIAGDRCAYKQKTLTTKWDWQKYLYTYRVWGRAMYNPQFDRDDSRRWLRKQFGAEARDAELAMASASRILPTITTAHAPSAANNNYWPEIYTNQSIVIPGKNQYSDMPSPKIFGNTTAFDPQIFSTVNGFADELISGKYSGKYSPVEVAQWLNDFAKGAQTAARLSNVEAQRWAVDITIQALIGRFFASKFRAGVLYGLFERTGDRALLEAAIKTYKSALQHWSATASAASVYVADVTAGEHPWLRGNWSDRATAIADDIKAMEAKLENAKASGDHSALIALVLGQPKRVSRECKQRFAAGAIELVASDVANARLLYRHVTQEERFQSLDMAVQNGVYRAVIPASYLRSNYPLQYYFELYDPSGDAWLYPGLGKDLMQQPYFIINEKGSSS